MHPDNTLDAILLEHHICSIGFAASCSNLPVTLDRARRLKPAIVTLPARCKKSGHAHTSLKSSRNAINVRRCFATDDGNGPTAYAAKSRREHALPVNALP